jgi:nitroreductase
MPESVTRFLAGVASIRKFRPVSVDRQVIARAIQVAQRAPSASNHQPYSVIEVRSPKVRKELLAAMAVQSFCVAAPVMLVVCVDWTRQDQVARKVTGSNAMTRDAKLVLGISDASIFAQHLALAMQASGLGVCYVASPFTALEAVAEILQCPPASVMPLHILVAGVPDEQPAPRPRYAVSAVHSVDRHSVLESAEIDKYLAISDESYQRENYGAIAEDGCDSIYTHYAVKYGRKALERTWLPLSNDIQKFFKQDDLDQPG